MWYYIPPYWIWAESNDERWAFRMFWELPRDFHAEWFRGLDVPHEAEYPDPFELLMGTIEVPPCIP